MNTTTEELDSRYIITKPGYTFGKLLRQPGGVFHCPHLGCDYVNAHQTAMGMHRKARHGHKTTHTARYQKQWQKQKRADSREPQKTTKAKPVQDAPNILTGEILLLRRMQVLFELADFILSTRRTGNNGAIL